MTDDAPHPEPPAITAARRGTAAAPPPATTGLEPGVVFHFSSNAMAISEMDTGEVVDVNDAWTRMTGVSREQAVGRKACDLGLWVDPADRERCFALLRKVGYIRDVEYSLLQKSRNLIHLMSAKIVEIGGRPRILWEFRDISRYRQVETQLRASESELRRWLNESDHSRRALLSLLEDHVAVEAALRESERRYRLLAENTLDVIWQLDLDLRTTYINPACYQLVGYTAEELLGAPLSMYCAPAELQRVEALLARELANLAHHTGTVVETELEHRNGRSVPVEVRAQILVDADGRPFGVQGVTRDITERRRAHSRIQHLNDVLNAIREISQLIVREHNPDRLLSEACHILARTRGYRLVWIGGITRDSKRVLPLACAGRALGYLDNVVITWDRNDTGRGPVGVALRERRIQVCHDTGMDPDFLPWREAALTRGFRSLAAVPMIHDDRLFGALAVYADRPAAFDDDELHLLDQLAADLAFALQANEAEQARRRAEQDLVRAKIAAEAANRAKSEFLANMSHEIRTPMAAITGFAQLLMSGQSTPQEQSEHLQTIQRNADNLLAIINDILDHSKIEADRLQLEYTEWPPRQIVEDVLALLQVRAQEKHLSLEAQYDEPLPGSIRTDPLRVRQILINLVANAIKFTDTGGVRVTVRWTAGHSGRARMQFDVADSGIGISQEHREAIFHPFTQADMSPTRRFGGTGLGLSISRRLAEMLGGGIELTSEPGKGSVFTLTIDAQAADGADVPQPGAWPAGHPRADRAAASPLTSLRGRILLVDDAPEMAQLMRCTLAPTGLELALADNGLAACQQALASKSAGRPFDLILMDIRMPAMNGYEATRRLRENGWEGPIVALTAHSMRGDRERCLEAGCDDYLSKPVSQGDFFRILERYVSAAASPPAGTPPESELPPHLPEADKLFDGLVDDATIEQLVDEYAGTLALKAEALERALQAGDFDTLAEVAHGLKGMAAMYGFSRVSEKARSIRQLAANADLERLEAAGIELAVLCREESRKRSAARGSSRGSPATQLGSAPRD